MADQLISAEDYLAESEKIVTLEREMSNGEHPSFLIKMIGPQLLPTIFPDVDEILDDEGTEEERKELIREKLKTSDTYSLIETVITECLLEPKIPYNRLSIPDAQELFGLIMEFSGLSEKEQEEDSSFLEV